MYNSLLEFSTEATSKWSTIKALKHGAPVREKKDDGKAEGGDKSESGVQVEVD